MAVRDHIRFLLNGRDVTATPGASDMLLDWLRLDRGLTGTKEGCAEGDCGACTVLVGRLIGDGMVYEPVNACIRPLVTLDRCHVVTIEHLSADGLHPVQQAMIDHHASQCGFCTPGIVMALVAHRLGGGRESVETALQGNLCRCTGYAPIMRAAEAVPPGPDVLQQGAAEVATRLAALPMDRVETGPAENRAILPAGVDDLATVLIEHPGATVVAGATDVGLWVTKELRPIAPAVCIGHLADLRRTDEGEGGLTIGAAASYSDAAAVLGRAFPHLTGYWNRIGGAQVRAMGTVGGNIANGSPIGDTPPALIALGAEITLRRGDARRRLALEEFFLDGAKQDMVAGEFLETIHIPPDPPGARHAAEKISKRRDEDISSVAMGLRVVADGDRIAEARIAFGGMAATPRRAARAEAVLTGAPWSQASFESAAAALSEDFIPITDLRASAAYRMIVAQNLLRRFWLEQTADTPVRLVPA